MTDEQPLDDLAEAIAVDDAMAHLVLAWRTDAGAYRLNLVEIDDSVSETFRGYARSTASHLAQRVEVPYDPDWRLQEEQYFALPSDQRPAAALFASLGDFQNLRTFTRRQLTKPRMYVVAVQVDGDVALFGRRMAFLKVLKQQKGVFAAVWDGSTFNTLTDSVATFATTFDWVMWRGVLYVIDSGAFHAEFRDNAAVIKAVDEHVATVQERVTIKNAAPLAERCRANVAMASKLARIATSGLQITSSVDELKAYAAQYAINVAWDGDELVFDGSLEGQWAILKLLDEDRTEGPVSGRHYESASKRQV